MFRRMTKSAVVGAVAALAAATGVLVSATPAGAVTPAQNQGCSGSTCVTIPAPDHGLAPRGGQFQVAFSLNVTSGLQANVGFVAHQTSGVIPDLNSVNLDGSDIARSDVSVSGDDLIVDLSAVNPIGAGSHRLEYDANMSATASTDQSVTAQVAFDDAAGGPTVNLTSAPYKVGLLRPDFNILLARLYAPAIQPGTFQTADLLVGGPSNVPADLVLTTTPGFSVRAVTVQDTKAKLPCVHDGPSVTELRCRADLAGLATLGVQVAAASTAKLGLTGTVRMTVNPVGEADATPADNTATLPLKVAGTAALAVTFSPNGHNLYLNTPTRYTVTVTNRGPDQSTDTVARISAQAQPGEVTARYPASVHVRSAGGTAADWTIGTLAKGQSASLTVTLTSPKLGAKIAFGVYMSTDAYNPLECAGPACESSATLLLTTVAVPPPAPAVASAGPQLAATGGPVRAPLGVAIAALLAGAVLLRVARRRAA